jgi:hypothetical protein
MKKKLKPKRKGFDPVPVADERPGRRSDWIKVAAAWLAVAVPLAWGVLKTLEKAAILLRG